MENKNACKERVKRQIQIIQADIASYKLDIKIAEEKNASAIKFHKNTNSYTREIELALEKTLRQDTNETKIKLQEAEKFAVILAELLVEPVDVLELLKQEE